MNYHADVDIGRNVIRRVEVLEVDDSGPIQKVTVMGLADEIFKLPLRGQPHGLTSVPKKGAIGYVLMANGRPDQAFLLGMEHEDDRKHFAGREAGESTHYGGAEQEVFHDKDGNTRINTPGGIVYVNCA